MDNNREKVGERGLTKIELREKGRGLRKILLIGVFSLTRRPK